MKITLNTTQTAMTANHPTKIDAAISIMVCPPLVAARQRILRLLLYRYFQLVAEIARSKDGLGE